MLAKRTELMRILPEPFEVLEELCAFIIVQTHDYQSLLGELSWSLSIKHYWCSHHPLDLAPKICLRAFIFRDAPQRFSALCNYEAVVGVTSIYRGDHGSFMTE